MGIPEDIARLELSLRELIVKYEQYFCGIEKREPTRLLEEVERVVRRYANISISNTSQRFKYDSLVASLSVHKQKWIRINRLIEEGKYQRDRFRMALHQQQASEAQEENAAPPQTDTAADPLERIYRDYLAARQACDLPTDNVSREAIAAAIERHKPVLREKYGCSDIDFVVVIEQGKPRLKARPKNA